VVRVDLDLVVDFNARLEQGLLVAKVLLHHPHGLPEVSVVTITLKTKSACEWGIADTVPGFLSRVSWTFVEVGLRNGAKLRHTESFLSFLDR
jgi:hypothetical protein